MLRFGSLNKHKLFQDQNSVEDIYHLKKNDYISDLYDEEIEEIKYF